MNKYQSYETEIETLLINSFQPYADMIIENNEAIAECWEVLDRPIIRQVNNEIVNEFLANGGDPKDLCKQYSKSDLPAELAF